MRDPELFDYWVIRHPGRLSALLGFCDRGRSLVEEISEAFGAEQRRPEMPNGKQPKPGKGDAPPRAPGDQDPPTERESFFDTVAGIGAGAAEGALRGTPAGGAIAGALSKVPWDKIIKAILEGAEAKKDKDFLKGFVKVLLAIDDLKDLLLKLIDDGRLSEEEKSLVDSLYQGISDWLNGNGDKATADARKKKAHDELRPKIRQAEEAAHAIGRSIDRDDFDDARQRAKNLVPLIEGIRDWIRDNMK